MIRLVPDEDPPPLTLTTYRTQANRAWRDVKLAHVESLAVEARLAALLSESPVKWHHVRSARHEAERLRAVADQMVTLLTEIVDDQDRVGREAPDA